MLRPKPLNWKTCLRELQLEPCRPPPWARGGHAQTLWGHFLVSPKPKTNGDRQVIPLPDGDALAAHYFGGTEDVVLYLFHGLAGSIDSGYMRRLIRLGIARGYHVLAVNHRGCGSGRGLAAQPYHSGRAEDLAEAIRHGRALFPDKLHVAIGFSLSGNALLLLAAGYRGKVWPDLAVAVNAPVALDRSAAALARGLNRLYDYRFSFRCRQAVVQRFQDGLIPTDYAIPYLVSLTDFDNLYTAPAGGFADRDDYYQSCSAKAFLDKIQIPCVMLTSKDDPMVDYRDYMDTSFSPNVHFHLEPNGGHMGYLNRSPTPLGSKRWLDYALDGYVRAFHNFHRGGAS